MKSTWRTADKRSWYPQHWLLHILNVHPQELNKPVPVHAKTDKLPYLVAWWSHVWIWTHAGWPMLVQFIWQNYTKQPWSALTTFSFYTLAMQINSIHQIWIMRRLGHRIGFLDGDKHPRDGVPDVGVFKTVQSLLSTVTFRPMIAVIASYSRSRSLSLSPWLIVELALYGPVLDLFFYAYHRSCHELDGLWQYHRTHHLTKHPNVLLSSYADTEQEFLEIMLIPFLAWAVLKYVFGLPMSFHDWWVCHEYVIFSEALGHSGLRMSSCSPSLAEPFLYAIGAELQLEDHDLHHRKGWRKSTNYGKQTRLWDKVFGTMGNRIECTENNTDYNDKIYIPLL